ncbi:MAG: hypothetical protein JST49_13405 [Bacteroidetes bacterium]|nr:hypothetical protein [Bacteroidota bacterium]
MKHCALTILTLLYVLTCLAQEYNEVVFEVKKNAEEKVCTYLYSQQQQVFSNWKGSAPSNYSCIQKIGDTLYHYTIKNIADTVGLIKDGLAPRIDRGSKYFYYQYATIYNVVNDTVWEKRIYSNGYVRYEMFCNSNVLSNGSKEDFLGRMGRGMEESVYRTAYMLDTNTHLTVDGKKVDCIKVLVTYGIPQIKGNRITRNTSWLYDRTYLYLRKTDFMPVMIETASEVEDLNPYAPYELQTPAFKLFKAIE